MSERYCQRAAKIFVFVVPYNNNSGTEIPELPEGDILCEWYNSPIISIIYVVLNIV